MSIRYQPHPNSHYPGVFCGVCDKLITGTAAIAVFRENGETEFAHRGECSRQLGRRQGYPYWEPIAVFFFNLLHNTKMDKKALASSEAYREAFGVSCAPDTEVRP